MGSPDTVDYHVESKVTVLELGTHFQCLSNLLFDIRSGYLWMVILSGAPLRIPDRGSHVRLQMGDAVSQLVTFSRGPAYRVPHCIWRWRRSRDHTRQIFNTELKRLGMVQGDLKRLYVLPSSFSLHFSNILKHIAIYTLWCVKKKEMRW